eukprot:Nitzschia sp. Nitz4//scaffold11_size288233//93698//98312//NITZ4_000757-RA/size288233-snap-gene-0.43-mRNA-1//-1//CDS//3329534023//3765//frame0
MTLKPHTHIRVLLFVVVALVSVASPFVCTSAIDIVRPHSFASPPPPTTPEIVTRPGISRRFQLSSSNDEVGKPDIHVLPLDQQPGPVVQKATSHGFSSLRHWASRLLFSYVSPIMDLASNRTLTEKDTIALNENEKMDVCVEGLTAEYATIRQNARREIEEATEKGVNYKKKSETMLLLKAVAKQQKGMLLLSGSLRLLNTAVQAFPALLVSRFLKSVEQGNAVPITTPITAAVMLVSVLSVKMVTESQFFHNAVGMATTTRGALEGLIFDKSMRLPDGGSGVLAKQRTSDTKKALGNGGVLNLMQSDTPMIEAAAMQVHTLWDGPLQIAMYTTLLYRYLGRSVLYGLAVLLTVIPLNSVTLRILDRLSKSENEARDARTKRTAESINNMLLLKFQGWEDQFAKGVREHRSDELRRHRMRGIVRAINTAVSNSVPALVLVATFAAYHRTGQPIRASTVFTSIALFNQLRFPLMFFPMLIDNLANGANSLRRIATYLTAEEITPYVQQGSFDDGGAIEMKNGNFLWPSSGVSRDGEVQAPQSPALCNVNMKVNKGEIVAVVGPVGSGKSALIKGLLGELAPVPRVVVDKNVPKTDYDATLQRPGVQVNGKIGYCSQSTWLPKGSIRDAIVFGREFDQERYENAIFDAGLDKDMGRSSSVAGILNDDTDVGEGGSNLSGGQRARVALARALYSSQDTSVFLLDDCLAALDATVGAMVFERISNRFKAMNSAAVIVTNDPTLPRRCDRVILMGPTSSASPDTNSTCSTIHDVGTHGQLLARGHKLQELRIPTHEPAHEVTATLTGNQTEPFRERESTVRVPGGYVLNTTTADNCHPDPECTEVDWRNNPDAMTERVMTYAHERDSDEAKNDADTEKTTVVLKQAQKRYLSTDDSMSTEAVPLSAYVGYIKAVGSPALIAMMLLAFALTNSAQLFQQYTLAAWTEVASAGAAGEAGARYVRSLVNAAGVVSLCLWLRSYLLTVVCARASNFYHDNMVSSVFRAPMAFFDATPSGQLLSRFGKELGIVDRALPDTIGNVLFCFLQIAASTMALARAISPAMLGPMAFAGTFYLRAIKRFRPAARDMKRAETKSRSPIFTHFAEALRGTDVIRSIPGAWKSWSSNHRALCETNLAVFSTIKILDRWLSVRLESLGNSMVLASALGSVILSRVGKVKPGSAGWGLTQSLAITGLMAWAVRNLTGLESHMMSVMRVQELSDMPHELAGPGEALAALHATTNRTTVYNPSDEALRNSGWPWKGAVKFNRVSMRYNPGSPLVLNDVSLTVPSGSTLGIVGRTGSGKSSLLLTLFRIVDIEKGGNIEIDGVDIRSVSLETLRSRLSIIPQNPVLFAGTIGYNLDATGKANASDMWEALEAASPELARQFRESGGLNSPISEGGNNLSLGQRQLICLARALVRKSKVLVMDEATSSVDPATDRKVQATIHREFVEKGVSVITVAHRLDTVLGHDKIAVMGEGEILEYGSPGELLRNHNGELRKLVDADLANKAKGVKAQEAANVLEVAI